MENKLVVYGGNIIKGNLKVSGAKNSILGLIAAALIAHEPVIFTNVPNILDIENYLKILNKLGVESNWIKEEGRLAIHAQNFDSHIIDVDLARSFRASIGLICPLLIRKKKIMIPFPGGDQIGERPLAEMMRGIEMMGARIKYESGIFLIERDEILNGIDIELEYPSHSATIVLMVLASFAQGKTTINNAALEPEIIDMQNLLTRMGVRIYGAGSSKLIIYGTEAVKGCEYDVMPDRLQIGTYVVATLMTDGEILVPRGYLQNLESFMDLIKNIGAIIETVDTNTIRISGKRPYRSVSFETNPYPGVPTDLQAILTALLTTCSGESYIKENVFENRLHHIPEIIKLGGIIEILSNREVVIKGPTKFEDNHIVVAKDIRGGMSLLLCGLSLCEGEKVTINNTFHIERGYPDFVKTFNSLGAHMQYQEGANV